MIEETELSKAVMTAVQSKVNKSRGYSPKTGFYEYTPYLNNFKIQFNGIHQDNAEDVDGTFTCVYSFAENKHYTYSKFKEKYNL